MSDTTRAACEARQRRIFDAVYLLPEEHGSDDAEDQQFCICAEIEAAKADGMAQGRADQGARDTAWWEAQMRACEAKLAEQAIVIAALQTKVKAVREECAETALAVWKNEPDLTAQNRLSHGCIAAAKAIRARGESDE